VSILVNRGYVHDNIFTNCDGLSSTHMRKPRELKCGDILKRGDIRIKNIKGGFRKDDLVPRESLLEYNQK